MLEWQLIHDGLCADRMCAGTSGMPAVEFGDGK